MIRPKHALLAAALGGSILTGCQHAAQPTASSAELASLQARVAKLEAANARYAEPLEMLKKVYDEQKAQAEAEEENEPAPDAVFAVDIAPDIAAGQVQGPADAPVTIVDAFDFACPYCRRVADTLDDLVKHNQGKVRVVYKNMIIHDVAKTVHLASCAAAKQGKYVAFKDAYWVQGFDEFRKAGDPSKIDESAVLTIAKNAGLDPAKLEADMHSEACKQQITADMDELAKFHVDSTPTLFVNGTAVLGAQSEDDFQQLIDQKVQAVQASGVPAGQYYDKVIMTKGEKKFRSKKDPKPAGA